MLSLSESASAEFIHPLHVEVLVRHPPTEREPRTIDTYRRYRISQRGEVQ